MKVEQIYTGCLAQGTYYIESKGEVAIIDPLREVKPYIEKAKSENATIKYIFETHFHADFVSGHVTLSKETGAPIVFGPTAKANFNVIIAEDNQEFKLGDITIKVMHTPGHTMESVCYLLIDENGKNHAIFTGDTLFLGDVGRPDLAQKAAELTQRDLAGMLFESLRKKIMPLADDVIVYPAHGAGSACGKNMMKQTVDTLGNQKKVNYALRANMTKEEFIEEVTDGLLPPPNYFLGNVQMNKKGYEDVDKVIEKGIIGLTLDAFEKIARDSKAVILDVRHQNDFVKGHIPKSIFIGIDGNFAPWVGAILADVKQPILLIVPKGREKETITRLSRVGFDNTLGYLEGGFDTWKAKGREYDTIHSISALEWREIMTQKNPPVYDVRKETEFKNQSVKGDSIYNTPLDYLEDYIAEFPKKENFYVYCAGGYRSVIASSILKNKGIHHLVNISGGFKAIQESGIPITTPACSSSLS